MAAKVVREMMTRRLVTLETDRRAVDAAQSMRDHDVGDVIDRAVRRLPVVSGSKPVGIVTLGDLAVEQDRESALGRISAAPPNR